MPQPIRPSRLAAVAVLLLGLVGLVADPAAAADLRVYHVGNSITSSLGYNGSKYGTSTYTRMNTWAQADTPPNSYAYGNHIIPGANLRFLWEFSTNQKDEHGEFIPAPYDQHRTALRDQSWNAVTLQLNEDSFNDAKRYAQKFIDETRSNGAVTGNTSTVFYLFQRPLRRNVISGGYGPMNYETRWLADYGSNPAATSPSKTITRDYSYRVIEALREQNATSGVVINMIPAGDVFYELDQRIQDDPTYWANLGLPSIETLYSDASHFERAEGAVLMASIFYATLYGTSPVGLSGAAWGLDNQPLANALQQVVWDVVRTHQYSGVPEPATAFLLLALGAPKLLRRRA